MRTLPIKSSVWTTRSKKLGSSTINNQIEIKKEKRKKIHKKKILRCALSSAEKVLGANRVFTETHCPQEIKLQIENVTQLGGRRIPTSLRLLREVRESVCLFYIPTGISVSLMQKSFPKMFGDLSGLIPEIECLESFDEKPWNWFAVLKCISFDSPKVLLLIEVLYIHIAYRLATGKNFFNDSAVVCYALEPRSTAVAVFFSPEGVISILKGNHLLDVHGYVVGKML
ncbi:MAG: hypothetical protein WCQ00_03910 [bacterium]